MTNFLLISVGLAQLVQIIILFSILRKIDTTGFSKEDDKIRKLNDQIRKGNDELSNIITQLKGK